MWPAPTLCAGPTTIPRTGRRLRLWLGALSSVKCSTRLSYLGADHNWLYASPVLPPTACVEWMC